MSARISFIDMLGCDVMPRTGGAMLGAIPSQVHPCALPQLPAVHTPQATPPGLYLPICYGPAVEKRKRLSVVIRGLTRPFRPVEAQPTLRGGTGRRKPTMLSAGLLDKSTLGCYGLAGLSTAMVSLSLGTCVPCVPATWRLKRRHNHRVRGRSRRVASTFVAVLYCVWLLCSCPCLSPSCKIFFLCAQYAAK